MEVAGIVRETQFLLSRSLKDSISLDVSIPGDLPLIMCAPEQFQQLLINLVFNARDAVSGSGRISISSSYIPEEQSVRVTVADTGPGIPEELRTQIFEAFFTTKGKLGTGLGLSTSAAIMASIGGRIEVESSPGHGTEFHLYFATPTEAATPLVKTTSEKGAALAEGEPIMVVEDEPQVQLLVSRVLEQAGYRVKMVSDAAEALHTLESGQDLPSLVVIDLGLPKMKGNDLAAILQAKYPELVMLMTSGGGSLPDDEGVPARFLSKPFSPKTLLKKVQNILSDR
jgi:CheY-like chemotaxis protein